jgi:hypothetical protein
MTTLSQVCKAIVTEAIDHDYLLECRSLSNVYQSEYGYNGVSPRACRDYLQGLPSVCTVPFDNYEILSILGDKIGVDFNDDDKCHEAIEAYWQECGKQFYLMVR